MTTAVIISVCTLLLLAYLFDLTSAKTKIPAVILLILLGWGVRQVTGVLQAPIPNLTPILPILGTIGLILIVLEGSLELELNRSKMRFVGKASLLALLPMLLFSFGLAYAFQRWAGTSFMVGMANAVPFAIISSAIAIPSAQNLLPRDREFVTYESSLSDIFGVLVFNFITLHETITGKSVGEFFLQIIVMLLITFLTTLLLAFLLGRIRHHVKFGPIILMVLLIYAGSKIYHLPGLIFILLFGLFLGNLDEFRSVRFIQKLRPQILNQEVHKFKDLTTEITFLIRALFFLVFGYLIETQELLNVETIAWATGITLGIFVLRFLALKAFRMPTRPLLFIAPRGLITILLFLSLPASLVTDASSRSLLIQVIILTALVMMFGAMTHPADKKPLSETDSPEPTPLPVPEPVY